MRILRVENKECIGVYHAQYKGKSVWKLINDDFVDPYLHPLPSKDSILDFDPWFDTHKVFGFINFEQFKNWFYNDFWLMRLEVYGFSLSIYEVKGKSVKYDLNQAVFIKNEAVLLDNIKLSDFVKNKEKYK